MKKNIGSLDRALRFALTILVGILLLTGTLEGVLGVVLGVLALVFLVTGAMSRCPLYVPFSIRTRKTE
ncbi:MAG: DUF2892 domain-containing protein [Bacteroidota bacterium]